MRRRLLIKKRLIIQRKISVKIVNPSGSGGLNDKRVVAAADKPEEDQPVTTV
jgi:hypothetical protein